MNSVEFEKLPWEKKCRYIWTHCTFLATRFQIEQNRKFRINLFYNGRFFIEVLYNSEYDYFGDINAFHDKKSLEPYMDVINLEELMAL